LLLRLKQESVWLQFWQYHLSHKQWLLIKVKNFDDWKAFTAVFWPFLFAHAHKCRCLYFRSKFCHGHFQRHRFPIKFRNVGDLTTFFVDFGHIFTCTETPISKLPATILTMLLDSATPISCKAVRTSAIQLQHNCDTRIFLVLHLRTLNHFLRCACAESSLFMLPVQNLLLPSFSVTLILYKRMKIFAIWQCFRKF